MTSYLENIVNEETFDWIENFTITAKINKISGKMSLELSYLENSKVIAKTSINCVHVVINKITPEKYNENINDPDFNENLIETMSSEGKIVNLSLDEKWFALKSWVQGIVENPFFSFVVNYEVDQKNNWSIPIINTLMKFVIIYDTSFLEKFINFIFKMGYFEGEYQKSYLLCNLNTIFSLSLNEKEVDLIFSYDLPLDYYFHVNLSDMVLAKLIDYHIFQDLFLSQYEIDSLKKEYFELFFKVIVANRYYDSVIPYFRNHLKLITSEFLDTHSDYHNRYGLILETIHFIDQDLFDLAIERFSKFQFLINKLVNNRTILDINLDLTGLLDYISDKNILTKLISKERFCEKYFLRISKLVDSPFESIRKAIVNQYILADLIPNEYDKLFNDFTGAIRLSYLFNPKVYNRDQVKQYLNNSIRRKQLVEKILDQGKRVFEIIDNNLEIFDKNDLIDFFDQDQRFGFILRNLAKLKLATELDLYSKLFNMDDLLPEIFRNPECVKFKEFEEKFTFQNFIQYQLIILENPSIVKHQLFTKYMQSQNETGIQDSINTKKYSESISNIKDLSIYTKMELSKKSFIKFEIYGILFNDRSSRVKRILAENLDAPENPQYIKLFKSKNFKIIQSIIRNKNAYTKYPEMYNKYFYKSNENILLELCKQYFLINTINYKILLNHKIPIVNQMANKYRIIFEKFVVKFEGDLEKVFEYLEK